MIWRIVKGVFKVVIGAYEKRADQATQLRIAEIDAEKLDARNRASLIRSAMSFKIFWVVWAMCAVPSGAWYALVMIDTMTPAHMLNMGIPMLPVSIKPYFDMVFNSVFYSGAAVGSVQTVVRGVLNFAANRK